jgi:hypothetical protein
MTQLANFVFDPSDRPFVPYFPEFKLCH